MLAAAFNLILGWFGVATLIGLAAVAVAMCSVWIGAILPGPLTFLTAHLRHYAIIVAIAAFSFTSVSGKYYHEGLTFKQAQWDAAKLKALAGGNSAHTGAERDVDNGLRDDRDTDR